uniref:Uncharacterized protein n=1 Tax=Arundo donax TaxID=35708 RepID=A0A0A9DFY0_ARUDO
MSRDAAPESLAAWLSVAARRLSGRLIFHNLVRGRNTEVGGREEAAQRGPFVLPCFESATAVSLDLGFLGLSVPPAGVFARLSELCLIRVRFHGPCELGDAVSSPLCPCLLKLSVRDTRGLGNLSIHSESLLRVELINLRGLRQLAIVAPALERLRVSLCFFNDQNQPVASISAPQLVLLGWNDLYDPSSVHLGKMGHLQWLASFFFVYGQDGFTQNRSCLRLLKHFKVIDGLILTLAYLQELDNQQYLMDDMTVLPGITILHLIVMANGHAFGASSFHVLRMCSGIRKLILGLAATDSEAQTACPSGCICGQQAHWKTEELLLNHLQEVEIRELRGSEHEVAFLRRLFSWATVLKKITVTLNHSVSESMAKELRQMLQSFCRPEICMEFYMYNTDMTKVLYAPED